MNQMREAFEKWASCFDIRLIRDSVFPDEYIDGDADIAWRVWQAAQSNFPSPDPVKLAELGWQMIECPICGGGAQAFPKPDKASPAQEKV